MGAAGRTYVQARYDRASVAARMEELYVDVLSSRRRSRITAAA
jgi:hypothetical protein